mmetsp:Transcript_408/g.925  ORF Transcript_408/g.925 Transcript_408/m.925 type:complete len:321 (+) Transcript_408:53-1015(+)
MRRTRLLSIMLLLGAAESYSQTQTLCFKDKLSGTSVHIIGTMHYNPHSVKKVEDVIRQYGSDGRLGAVVLEQCKERWALTQSMQPPGSMLRGLLDNEFQAAAELASFYDREYSETIRLVLADEDIRDNNERMNDAFASTIRDIANPGKGGWRAIALDLRRAYAENTSVVPTVSVGRCCRDEREYLGYADLFDANLLLSAPISLIRYILAFVAKKPIRGSLLLTWVSALIAYGLMIHDTGDLTLTDEAMATAVGLLLNLFIGVPLLGRVVLVALLSERNKIIASHIRAECDRLQAEGRTDQECIVVLGLAHCNGVKRILCE